MTSGSDKVSKIVTLLESLLLRRSGVLHAVSSFFGRQRPDHEVADELRTRIGWLDLAEFPELDRVVRTRASVDGWWSPTKDADFDEWPVEVIGAVASHRDGYVRELAVRRISLCQTGVELPFLLIRTNDWVPVVRDLALEAVLARIKPDYATHFLKCSPLVERLRGQFRSQHGALIEAIESLIIDSADSVSLVAKVDDKQRHVRRYVFSLLARRSTPVVADLIQRGMGSRDEILRLRAVGLIRLVPDRSDLNALLERAMFDPFMPVRREALRVLAERDPLRAESRLRSSLFDSHTGVRWTASHLLARLGVTDFRSIYRQVILQATDTRLDAAIAGLGETGTREDAALLLPFLGHSNPRISRAALHSLAALDSESHVDRFWQALREGPPSVTRVAAIVINARRGWVTPAILRTQFEQATSPWARRQLLRLSTLLVWWDAAPIQLRAVVGQDDSVRSLAIALLQHQMSNPNRLSLVPSHVRIEELAAALESARPLLDAHIRGDIEAHLWYARRSRSG